MADPSGQIGVPSPAEDGIGAEALILDSVAGPRPVAARAGGSGTFDAWEAAVPMLVTLPGQPAYHAAPTLPMTRAKYPIAGTTLPVTVEPNDRSRVGIEWDRVPDIDRWIQDGNPVFTDPDTVHVHLVKALDNYEASLSLGVAQQAAAALGPGAAVDPKLLPRVFEQLRTRLEPPAARPQSDRPTGTVLAASTPDTMSTGEVLLSVAIPGRLRYGLRWRGSIPADRAPPTWSRLPLEVHSNRTEPVDISWDQVPDVYQDAAIRLRAYGDRVESMLRAGPMDASAYEVLLSAIPDPDRRAQVREQIAQAMRGPSAPPMAPAAPASRPDPLDELKRLGELRASGALTEAEFAAAKARLLEQM